MNLEFDKTPLSVSVVVPVYSGDLYLRDLVAAIVAEQTRLTRDDLPFRIMEIILVDDGAINSSPAIVDELAEENDIVTALHMSRNFGQHPATIAGILHSSGEWVVTMDEDLQHPPEKIAQLFDPVASKSADVIYGKPEGGAHKAFSRDLTSRGFKRALEFITNNKHLSKINSFRLLRGDVARAASSVCGQDTFFDVALGWFTTRIVAVPMVLTDQRYIETKQSGYNLKSLASHARRMAFTSHMKILRYGTMLGALMLAISIIAVLLIFLIRIFSPELIISPGWSSLMVTLCFIGGLSLFMIGVILEYVSVLAMRANGKPLFFTINRSRDGILREWAARQVDDYS